MGRPKRTAVTGIAGFCARGAAQGENFQQFILGQRRQNARQALRQHGFASARWATQQQVMPAHSRHFQGAAGQGLAMDLTEVRIVLATGR